MYILVALNIFNCQVFTRNLFKKVASNLITDIIIYISVKLKQTLKKIKLKKKNNK